MARKLRTAPATRPSVAQVAQFHAEMRAALIASGTPARRATRLVSDYVFAFGHTVNPAHLALITADLEVAQ